MGFFSDIKDKFLGFFGKSEEDEEAKAAAKAILKDFEEAHEKADELYEQVVAFLKWVLKRAEKHFGKMPTEEDFLKILSYIGDEKIEVSGALETIDRKLISHFLESVDKNILDKFVGKDWYQKLLDELLEEEDKK